MVQGAAAKARRIEARARFGVRYQDIGITLYQDMGNTLP
jgi:hypothetical protein